MTCLRGAEMTTPNRAKLTKGYVDRIKPGPKDEFHWDTDTKGFGVRVTPTGKLTFIVQGRVDGTEAAIRTTTASKRAFRRTTEARAGSAGSGIILQLGVDGTQHGAVW